jgi:hypothetical protein
MSQKIRGLIGVGSWLILLHVVMLPALAQDRGSTGGRTSSRETMLQREEDLTNRDLRLRVVSEPEKVKEPPEEERKYIKSQIFEDFEHIQTIAGKLTEASSKGEGPNYKRISNLSADLHKRAKRLKTNLAIPDVEDEKKNAKPALAKDGQEVKGKALGLNQLVKSFVTNPIFKDPRVAQVRDLTRLRQDLLDIIELSQLLKKSAETLD